MSTKTSIKRVALVAVSALGFGVLSMVPATAVSGTGTATLSGPVRVSFTDGTRDTVAAQGFTFTNIAAEIADAAGTTLTMEVTQAPTSGATVQINLGGSENTSDSLGASATAATTGVNVLAAAIASGATGAAGTIAVTSNPVAGTYKGTFTLGDGTDDIVVSWQFTTTGKVATINTDSDSYGMPAVAETSVNAFAISKLVTVTLKDSAGNTTQAATGDSVTTSITSATNINTKVAANNTTSANLTFSASDLNDGSHTFRVGSVTAVADSETVTLTPAGIMPAQGVVAKSFTATTVGYGTETALNTVLSSPTSATIVKAATPAGAEEAYLVDESNTSYVFDVSGYTAGAAYKIQVLWTDAADANGTATVKDDTSNTTAASLTSATASVLYGIVGSSGTVKITVASTANNNTADSIKINPESATANDYDDAADAFVTNQTTAYRVKMTTPTVTPSMSTTGARISVAGDVKDQYGNAVIGATVTVTGTPTTTDATVVNLTATAVTDSTGAWSLTMPAATALTTVVTLRAAAVKTGVTILSSNNAAANGADLVVNLTASGSPTTMTFSNVSAGSQDPAAALTVPQVRPIHDGTATAATDETTTLATGLTATGALDAADELARFTVTTDPGSQVVVTASSNVLLYTATGGTVATGVATLTVASAGNVYAAVKTVGSHTVTFTSGSISKTWTIYGTDSGQTNKGEVIRNIAVDKTSMSLKPSEIGYVTLTLSDVFGNAIKSAVAAGGASVSVTASGAALLDGPAVSKSYTTTDDNGQIVVGVIASGTPGTATITVTGTGAQLGAAAGAVSGTTAGTNGFTASTSTATVTVTVAGDTAKSAEVLASEAAEAEAKKATTAAGEAKTEAAAATTKAADALAEAKLATAAATKAGTDAVAAADAAKTAAVAAADAAKAEAKLAIDAAKAAEAEAKLATAAAKANGEELAKVIKSLADLLALVTKNDADLKAAAEAAVDAALEAIDAANAATDAANTGAEASDASIVAAEEARDAADAATATAEEARDAATEAIDAANAATDAANLALEAAEAATVAAEEARDAADAATAAVEALASEVSTLIAGVTAQIKTLGNVVAKIAKKVKA